MTKKALAKIKINTVCFKLYLILHLHIAFCVFCIHSIGDCLVFYYLVVKLRLRNDLYCVEWGVKLYSLTHLSSSSTVNSAAK